jgi:uncharacterized membrane protein (UPF0182 family)
MRVPSGARGRPRLTRWRLVAILVVVLLIVLLFSLRGIAGFWTDYLWFNEIGYGSVWSRLITARFVPALVFTAAFFVAVYGNLVIADRIAPQYVPTAQEDLAERYRRVVAPYAGRLRLGVAILFAFIAGSVASGNWRQWLLFRNAVSFGVKDDQFHKDVGYYIFKLPFYELVYSWVFGSLIVILIVTTLAHYLNGGIRVQGPFQRVSPQVKVHLSVLLASIALVRAWGYWLERYGLTTSTRGAVHGASATDVKAQLPALHLLIVISIAAVILFLVNIRLRGFALPVIAVGLWAFVSLAIGTIYPRLYQKLKVEPSEFEREEAFIARNIAATRDAFGIADVDVEAFPYAENLEAADLDTYASTLENARLWDPNQVIDTWRNEQQRLSFYQFNDLDVDRYEIDGRLTPTILGARELNSGRLPSSSWVSEHLIYTHGRGVAMAPSNAVDGSEPAFVVKDLPPTASASNLQLDRRGIYYGEELSGYVVVNSDQAENDPETEPVPYTGDGGIKLSNFARRVSFALRFADLRLILSGDVNGDSRVMIIRDIEERARKAAPFLRFDADPYAVVLDGRVVWVMDAYTATDRYPYAQAIIPDGLPGGSGLHTRLNYVRNSVKVVIDSYDGSVTYYNVDPDDKLLEAWSKAFPDLITPGDQVDQDYPGLRAHFRYPDDLFRVQTRIYASYHVEDPRIFYTRNDQWTPARDPGSGRLVASQQATGPAGPQTVQTAGGQPLSLETTSSRRIDPFYGLMRLPGADSEEFVILQPLVPVSRDDSGLQNLRAFVVASSDPESYGRLRAFTMPTEINVKGPAQASNEILGTEGISREFSLLNQQGSTVLLGNLQLLPIADSIVYVQPVYVRGNQATSASGFPQFRFVIVWYRSEANMAGSLCGALAQFDEFRVDEDGNPSVRFCEGADPGAATPTPPPGPPTPPTGPTPPPPPPGPETEEVASLLVQAQEAFARADTALRQDPPDFAEYAREVEVARGLLDRAAAAAGAAGDPGPTTTTMATTSTVASSTSTTSGTETTTASASSSTTQATSSSSASSTTGATSTSLGA